MKKTIACALTLILVFSLAFSACAEIKVYVMSGICDAEGNAVAIVSEDGTTVTDDEGNDITEDCPVMYFGYDDEDEDHMCYYGVLDQEIGGIYDVDSEDETTINMIIALDDGDIMPFVYSIADDTFSFTDDYEMTTVYKRAA